MVRTHFRDKTSISTEKAPEESDISTQMDLLKQETSVQAIDCSEYPAPSPEEKVSTCKSCTQAEDLLCQVYDLQ